MRLSRALPVASAPPALDAWHATARNWLLGDLNGDGARTLADELGQASVQVDGTRAADIQRMLDLAYNAGGATITDTAKSLAVPKLPGCFATAVFDPG